MSDIKFKLTAGTDVGLERNNNEDDFVVCADLQTSEWFIPQKGDDLLTLGSKGCLLAVADGMGGMNAGEVASGIAIDTVKKMFVPDLLTEQVTKDAHSITAYLKKAVKEADQAIKQHSASDESTRGMGTTLVIAWILEGDAYLAWCGDSRIYSYHPQSGLRQLSKDHSYVQQLVDRGKLDPQYAFDHPDGNIIFRSLGDPENKATADTLIHPLCNEEILLLCTDGLSGLCRDKNIQEIITDNYIDLTSCKLRLIQAALSAGGHDNVTVALFQQVSGGKVYESASNQRNAMDRKSYRKILWSALLVLLVLLVGGVGFYYGEKRGRDKIDDNVETVPADSVRMLDPPINLPAEEVVEENVEKPKMTKTKGQKETTAQGENVAKPKTESDTVQEESGINTEATINSSNEVEEETL